MTKQRMACSRSLGSHTPAVTPRDHHLSQETGLGLQRADPFDVLTPRNIRHSFCATVQSHAILELRAKHRLKLRKLRADVTPL